MDHHSSSEDLQETLEGHDLQRTHEEDLLIISSSDEKEGESLLEILSDSDDERFHTARRTNEIIIVSDDDQPSSEPRQQAVASTDSPIIFNTHRRNRENLQISYSEEESSTSPNLNQAEDELQYDSIKSLSNEPYSKQNKSKLLDGDSSGEEFHEIQDSSFNALDKNVPGSLLNRGDGSSPISFKSHTESANSSEQGDDIEILAEVKVLSYSDRRELEERIKKQSMVIEKNKRLLQAGRSLPDNGIKLKAFINKLEEEKERMENELLQGKKSSVDDSQNVQILQDKITDLQQKYTAARSGECAEDPYSIIQEISRNQKELFRLKEELKQFGQKEKSAWQKMREEGLDLMNNVTWNQWAQGPASNQLYGGRMNKARKQEASSVTQEAIKKLHDSLDTMPVESDMEEDPLHLKKSVSLFPHQKQALAWLLWRETQHPSGGILADDMGLGKTLTMISLILKGKELEKDSSCKEEWLDTKEGKSLIRSKGTLIICPASLISQWDGEVRKRLKSDTLNVLVYHGTTRGQSARSLARHDLVVTTYHTVMNDLKAVLGDGPKDSKLEEMGSASQSSTEFKNIQLLKVAWERIILDEAHQIRNPRSKTAQAVCKLRGAHRWCVTGTPIQNKELDMYSLIRFLRCAPFDEYRVWKSWVDNRTHQGTTRMNTLIKSLLLRRTKEQKSSASGNAIVDLPKKTLVEHSLQLTADEKKVYDKVFSLSQNAMINYMKKYHEERGEAIDLSSKYGSTASQKEDVKAHHLLVLLLRLRQICCHPSLIQSMLDAEVKSNEGIENDEGEDLDLISRMEDITIRKHSSSEVSDQAEEDPLFSANPVFNKENASSKIMKLMEALSEIVHSSEKVVIVSQWTSMLSIVESHVDSLGMKTVAINGGVPVKSRGDIVESFNSESKGSPRVMLLSLAAGGVGLNLTGGNHLFLLDMHWNPQLEQQACDRIYRVGQKRPIWIHKFLCEDTVESRINLLQQKKISLADGVLTGAKRTGTNKLSFEDLKLLFNVK